MANGGGVAPEEKKVWNGTVEAVLEGGAEAVEQVIACMRVGRSRAVVDDVRITDEPPAHERSFVVR